MNSQKNQKTARTFTDVRFSDIDSEKAFAAADKLTEAIGTVIIGKKQQISLLVTALLSGTHVLIEDVPGVGKTTLASAMAGFAGLDFRRAQFTPDITASDITGCNIYNRSTERFDFVPGLVMTNILLADEINRASPRTQSALLEAMEERQVTVDGTAYPLPDPFMVIATQNPSGFIGTYPLPESQLDRFGIRISMGYPDPEDEISIIGNRKAIAGRTVNPVISPSLVSFLRALVWDVQTDSEICRYIVALISATRNHSSVSLGASPRASITLKRLCQAYAFIHHRDHVVPDDVYEMFKPAISHRLIITNDARLRGVTAEGVLDEILRTVPIPYKGSRRK